MSIIHDALKKAQEDLKSSGKEKKETSSPPNTNEQTSSSPRSNTPLIVITLGMIIFGIICGGYFAYKRFFIASPLTNQPALPKQVKENTQEPSTPTQSQPKTSNQNVQQNTPIAKAQAGAQSQTINAQPSSLPPYEITIKGIMSTGDTNVVLINDDVYEVGEQVSGMLIKKITLKNVELELNGQRYIVPVKN
jgi:hypothetical protein